MFGATIEGNAQFHGHIARALCLASVQCLRGGRNCWALAPAQRQSVKVSEAERERVSLVLGVASPVD